MRYSINATRTYYSGYSFQGKGRVVGGYWVCSSEDEEWAKSKEWKLRSGYPCESGRGGRDAHRLIKERELGRTLSRAEQVHHKDENLLNGQRANLEVKSCSEHMAHHGRTRRRLKKGGLPPGVWPQPGTSRFQAKMVRGGKALCLGTYDTPEEASKAYREAIEQETT